MFANFPENPRENLYTSHNLVLCCVHAKRRLHQLLIWTNMWSRIPSVGFLRYGKKNLQVWSRLDGGPNRCHRLLMFGFLNHSQIFKHSEQAWRHWKQCWISADSKIDIGLEGDSAEVERTCQFFSSASSCNQQAKLYTLVNSLVR